MQHSLQKVRALDQPAFRVGGRHWPIELAAARRLVDLFGCHRLQLIFTSDPFRVRIPLLSTSWDALALLVIDTCASLLMLVPALLVSAVPALLVSAVPALLSKVVPDLMLTEPS